MDIQKDALLRVVKATRAAIRLAENTNKLMVDGKAWTWADEIAGQLADALFIISGEKLESGQDFFKDSATMMVLTGDMSDEGVTNWFIMMDRIRKRLDGKVEVQMPKPNVMNPEKMKELYQQNGGYQSPEGEWK